MLRKVFKAFSYPNFRLLWFGAFTSSVGTWMQQLAQSWWVFDVSKSAFYLGLDAFLGQLPIILFSLVGGVIADRMDRRKLLMISQIIQMISALIGRVTGHGLAKNMGDVLPRWLVTGLVAGVWTHQRR